MPNLRVCPQSGMVDEDVSIIIEGLQQHQLVTLVAVLRDEKVQMASYSHYRADHRGVVDVVCMPSIGGTYEGVEPMGFIWSMKITANHKSGPRLMKRNVQEPIKMDVKVYNGHIEVKEHTDLDSLQSVVSEQIERWYLNSEKVERIVVRSGRLVATMFVPKEKGQYPGVLDLFGSIGGIVEYRAALLASHGFVTMSLAYYWPPDKKMTDLEYFEEATECLWQHPQVLKTGLGVIGVSKGGELALLIPVVLPKVKASIAINGPPVVAMWPSTYNGETFPEWDFIANGVDFVQTPEGFIVEHPKTLPENTTEVIPIERSQAKFLLIHGADDNNTPTDGAHIFTERLRSAGRPEACKVLIYEGAGHLIEPPHSPHFRRSLHKMIGGIFVWGGEPKLHARAQEDSWRQIQAFLRETLTQPTLYSKL